MVSEQTHSSDIDPPTPLRRGRTDLSREAVVEHQRERVIASVATVIARHGYPGMTVERVIAAARISRTTFYQLFANKQEAVLVAHELIFERLLASILDACRRQEEWPGKIDAAIGTIVELATARPEQAHFLTAEFLAADAVIADRAREAHDQLAALLAGARQHFPSADSLPPVTERFLIGGLRSLIARWLRSDQPDQLSAMRTQLVEITLLPYRAASAMQA